MEIPVPKHVGWRARAGAFLASSPRPPFTTGALSMPAPSRRRPCLREASRAGPVFTIQGADFGTTVKVS
jgi:hypothetical protein